MEVNAIGLVGGMASGKDSFGKFIQDRVGGVLVSTSDVARDYIRQNNLGEATRDLTRNIATYLRSENGTDYLLRSSIENIEDDELAIVSGLYIPEEVVALRALRNSVIVRVDTSDDTRVSRAVKRSRTSDEQDVNNFYRLDAEDLHGSVTDQRLADVFEMADMSVDGNVPIANEIYWADLMNKVLNI